MALSYSLMIVIEALLLVSVFTIFLVIGRKKSASLDSRLTSIASRKKATAIGALLLIGSAALFLAPKVTLLTEFDYTKLTRDSWDHFLVIDSYSENTGNFETKVYPYYSKFPVTYSAQVMIHDITGLQLFESMTLYYIVAGIAGLLVVFGIGNEIIKGSRNDKIIFAGIAGIVYSFLQYLNLVFAQQYPIAVGTVAALLCVYSFVLMANKKKQSIIYLAIGSVILILAHPFAAIFVSLLFAVYLFTSKIIPFKSNRYQRLISRRLALFMCLAIIVAGMTYSMFVATGTFESGIRWSELNVKYTAQKLTSQLFESTTSGVGQSFEGRYKLIDNIIYPLNWALPLATSMSTLLFFLIRKTRVEEDQELRMLFPLAIVSTIMFVFTFAFSFVEFAFSRYFGAFALAFNIPITALVIFRMVKSRFVILRYATFAIIAFAIFASVTDPTMMPFISDGNKVYRDAQIYPTQPELVAWNDFFASVSGQQKLIRTNLDAAPINYFQQANAYNNEVVLNPANYTLIEDNAYLVIDKDKLDLSTELQNNPLMDKVYDNSKIYVGQ